MVLVGTDEDGLRRAGCQRSRPDDGNRFDLAVAGELVSQYGNSTILG